MAFLTTGSSLAVSKFFPASKPIRFRRAMIGSSVMCSGLTLSSSAAKNLRPASCRPASSGGLDVDTGVDGLLHRRLAPSRKGRDFVALLNGVDRVIISRAIGLGAADDPR